MLVAFDVFEFISESEKAANNDVLFFSMYTMLKPMYLTEKCCVPARLPTKDQHK